MPDDDSRLGPLTIPEKGILASLGVWSILAMLILGIILFIVACASSDSSSSSSSDFNFSSEDTNISTSLEDYCADFGDNLPEVCE